MRKEDIMMFTKRFAAAVLALSCALSFASCGGSESSSSDSAKETTTTTAAAESAADESAEESSAAESEETAESTEESAYDSGENTAEERPAYDETEMPGYDASATETVFEFTDAPDSAWGAAFPGFTTPEGASSDDFIDARSLEPDKDVHIKVEFKYTDMTLQMIEEGLTDLHKTQVVIGPCHANGWTKFGSWENPQYLVCDYPAANDLPVDGDWVVKGENVVSKDDEEVWADVFVKDDGFIKITSTDVTSIEFTIPADAVNQLIEKYSDENKAADPESAFDGILFQLGGSMSVTKVTIDQGNVFLASQIAEAGF